MQYGWLAKERPATGQQMLRDAGHNLTLPLTVMKRVIYEYDVEATFENELLHIGNEKLRIDAPSRGSRSGHFDACWSDIESSRTIA